MGPIAVRVGTWLLSALTTKTFLSTFIVESGRRYAKKTDGKWDDELFEFYGASLGIPPEALKELKKAVLAEKE